VSSKTRILLIALVLSVVTFPVGQIETASAEPSTGLFTAENVEGIGAAFGCMGAACPTEKRAMLGFKKQSTYPELAEASRIVTAPVPPPGTETTGCAIIATALKCFGKNTFGRIGNETSAATTDSFVSATRGGTPLTGVTDVDVTTETTCAIQSQKILCIGREEFTLGEVTTWNPPHLQHGLKCRQSRRYNFISSFNGKHQTSPSLQMQFRSFVFVLLHCESDAHGSTQLQNGGISMLMESLILMVRVERGHLALSCATQETSLAV